MSALLMEKEIIGNVNDTLIITIHLHQLKIAKVGFLLQRLNP